MHFLVMSQTTVEVGTRLVIPKVCSAAEVVRESLYKSIFCASRTTKLSKVVRSSEKFGNHCTRLLVESNNENGENWSGVFFVHAQLRSLA